MQLQRPSEQLRSNEKRRQRKRKNRCHAARNVFDEEPPEEPVRRKDSADESLAGQVVGLEAQDTEQQLGGIPFTIHSSIILAHTGALEERNQSQQKHLIRNQMYWGESAHDYDNLQVGQVSPLIQVQTEPRVQEEQNAIPRQSRQVNKVTVYEGGRKESEEVSKPEDKTTDMGKSEATEKTKKTTKRQKRQIFDEELLNQPERNTQETTLMKSENNVEASENSEPRKKRTAQSVLKKVNESIGQQPKSKKELEKETDTKSEDHPRIISIDSEESFKDFFNRPLPKGTLMQCQVRRFSEGLGTRFQMYLDDMRPLMCAISQTSITTNYHISMNRQTDRNSKYYLGKLRSNFTGSVYTLYGVGENPKKQKDPAKRRSALVNVEYQTNFLGLKGPRKLRVRTPNIETKDKYPATIYQIEDDMTLEAVQRKHHNSVSLFHNKEPRWNEKLKSYALNFGGRVKEASIKNFILIKHDPNAITPADKSDGSNVLIFGKISKDKFNLEFTWPFSPLQAFGIALSAFDSKLNCE